ncbi:DUF3742 family protein [Xanthomonas arboricola pv. corylina]|uniref:DUF3742 domain-containing protein n=1 Tax=Xanthomonas campestris pv. phaseoli TaxID=317013 RepID=A0AB34QGT6_XANCH|nr:MULTISPECIES: DUF3742 family protein [Gammaproteobacteria]ATS51812.1 DUF3742 family protein [Xanthomonas citri pv. phaseoli var. fuscans]ATS80322.1 DUF3742 family protein [Xanthomonas citri pv. phaseoli var. fuscans]KGT49315.1 hypothetical protein NZ02_20420 [Xanthomonas phaseoli pv. phaseoli]KHS36227.1 hypothetical protein RN20_14290 [Xanthomonas phaseoli pv. phaseoli]MBO9734846.1 DUF3742 family protein [Xanthomonas phaseoli pv. phaseoli]
MNTTTRISTAERLGRSVGRGWRAYARGERRLASWLASKGVPVVGAALALWVVKLAVLGLLLYVASWLAVLLLSGVAAAWMAGSLARRDDRWAQQDELRNGEAGFGLYSSSGQRIDPHDPNDPFDG